MRDIGKALKGELNITTFIETGTYKAETTSWAITEFKKVITIEAHEKHYNGAVKQFKDNKNVRCVFGDSLIELPKVIRRLRKPALLWLDAHKCRFEESLTASECPLIDELKAIRDTGIRHVIMIDDARMFIESPPEPYDSAQWPTYEQVKELLPDDYYIDIWHDAIIAVPKEAAHIVKHFIEPKEMLVVVLTSNKYVHCMPGFSYLFNKFWDAAQPVRVVRYDVRPPKMPGNFSNLAVGIQDKYTWSSGLIKYLRSNHEGELILLMLEDYFISEPVDKERIVYYWELIRTDQRIAKIDLSGDRLKVGHTNWNDDLILSNNDAPFQTSLQAAIWRKDFLLQFLDPTENAWQFEKKGTKRMVRDRQAGKFDGLILGVKESPLSYVNAKGGEGKHPEQWDFKKMPEWMVKELREKRLI